MKKTSSRKNTIWTVVAVLFLAVLLTSALSLNVFFSETSNSQADSVIYVSDNAPALADADVSADEVVLSDNPNAWTNTAQVDIFDHNDDAVKTDGTGSADDVIAPGTENTYTYSLLNELDSQLEYTMVVSAANDTEYEIPVQVQLLDGNGNSISGDWLYLSEFADVTDNGTISASSDVTYSIRWKWDFEGDNADSDVYDTYLGDTAVNEEISCHIDIKIVAEYDLGTDTDTDTEIITDTDIDTETDTSTDTTTDTETDTTTDTTTDTETDTATETASDT